MNRRDVLCYAASAAGALLPIPTLTAATRPCPPTQLSVAGGKGSSSAADMVLEDDFRGVNLVMPDGSKKLYPDPGKWAFTFWPGTKWPDSYGDGTNGPGGNTECQT